jgi:acyl-CoA dehydrogenase
LAAGVQALEHATRWLLRALTTDVDAALASSVEYLMMLGYVCGGWQMARAALVAARKLAADEDPEFHRTKLATARFYVEKILPKAHAFKETILGGASGAIDIANEQF